MFMVINKDKIVSYFVSLSTVVILFGMSFAITKKNEEILQTSINAVINNVNEIEKSNNNIKNEYNTIGEK